MGTGDTHNVQQLEHNDAENVYDINPKCIDRGGNHRRSK